MMRTKETIQRDLDKALANLAGLQGRAPMTDSRSHHRRNMKGPSRAEVEAAMDEVDRLRRELASE